MAHRRRRYGLVLAVVIIAASVRDRDADRPLLWNLSRCCTRVRLAWADVGYADKYARDYEKGPEGHEAMVLWAMVALMTQHLATQRRDD